MPYACAPLLQPWNPGLLHINSNEWLTNELVLTNTYHIKNPRQPEIVVPSDWFAITALCVTSCYVLIYVTFTTILTHYILG